MNNNSKNAKKLNDKTKLNAKKCKKKLNLKSKKQK